MTVFDATCVAVNVRNAGAALEGDHASGVGTLNVADVYDYPTTGQVSINGDIYDYTAIDDEANTVTLSGTTSAAYDDGTPAQVYPPAPVRYATVMIGDDQGGQNALVPHHLVALLDEQLQDTPDGFPVRVEPVSVGRMGWQVVEVPGQSATHNATTVPIVVTTEQGESVRIDGDGIKTFTNDPAAILTIPGPVSGFSRFATDGTHVWATREGKIYKFVVVTGAEVVGGGWPITPGTSVNNIATDGTYIYVTDVAGSSISKYNASTGASVGGGFPIAGTFFELAADGTYVYASDNAFDIRKYDAATGASVAGGFPIVGTYADLATDGTWLYARDGAGDLRKFDAATAAENLSGWPVAGTYTYVATDGTYVYASDFTVDADLHRFDATTGVESTDSGWPIEGTFNAVGADGTRVYGSSGGDIRVFNAVSDYQTVQVDSVDGSGSFGPVVASDITASGTVTSTGRIIAKAVTLDGISLKGDAFTNVTYNGSWTDFGAPYEEVSYRLLADGTVQLRGMTKHATTTTTGTVFTLPAGYRPAKQRHYKLDSNSGHAIVTIANTGVVSVALYGAGASAAFISFDGVTFDTAA